MWEILFAVSILPCTLLPAPQCTAGRWPRPPGETRMSSSRCWWTLSSLSCARRLSVRARRPLRRTGARRRARIATRGQTGRRGGSTAEKGGTAWRHRQDWSDKKTFRSPMGMFCSLIVMLVIKMRSREAATAISATAAEATGAETAAEATGAETAARAARAVQQHQ